MNNTWLNNSVERFWDRRDELAALAGWAGRRARLAVVHGRRRLGKTRLIRHWLRRAAGCYALAMEGPAAAQRAALADDIAGVIPGFNRVIYPTWRTLFQAVAAHWPRGPRLPSLIIDEFPCLAASSPELASVVQGFADADAAQRVPLLLCGSSQRMMQGLVLDASAPLYGRADLVLRLQPLPPTAMRAALRLGSAPETVEAYAAYGGVPRYWELLVETRLSLRRALEKLVFEPGGVLHEEPERVLRDEESAAIERAVCEMIGRGVRRASEIAGRLGVKETALARPLKHLTELGLVARESPFDFRSGRPVEGGRRSFYCVADPFLAMWYRCVRPNISGLKLRASTALERAWQAWPRHVADVWEDLCRGACHRLDLFGNAWEPAGRYWEGRDPGQSEWDVASVSANRRAVLLGECKWAARLTHADANRLTRQIKARPVPSVGEDRQVCHALFVPTRQGLARMMNGVAVVDAADVVGEDRTK